MDRPSILMKDYTKIPPQICFEICFSIQIIPDPNNV